MQNHDLQCSAAKRELSFGNGSQDAERVIKRALVERPVDGVFLRRLQREAKRIRGWSARVTAQHIGVTRATLKGMQSGKKTIGEMPQIHARNLHLALMEERAEQNAKQREWLVVMFAKGCDARIRQLKISRKPKKCRVCKHWFEPHSGRQQRCSACANEEGTKKKNGIRRNATARKKRKHVFSNERTRGKKV